MNLIIIKKKRLFWLWSFGLTTALCFRLGFTNIYSIDEYKKQSTALPPVLQRSKFCGDILNFLEQSCSYITQFLRSGRLFKMATYQPFAMPLVMPQPGF